MKLASFETITDVQLIEGADRIELARVQGWQSVIRKGEYKVGDRVIFVPIDTVLEPREWNKFLQDKNDPSKPIRVRTVKLRNTISQGLIFPISIVGEAFCWAASDEEDLPHVLGITKYEKPIPANLQGQVVGDFPTHLISKTDEDNLKSNIAALEELKSADYVQVNIKCDGSSASYIKELDGTFRVCSRNLELKYSEDNAFWQAANKYSIREAMPLGTCIQAELCGPGIQSNPMGLKELTLYVFNVKDLVTGAYRNIAPCYGIESVPFLRTYNREQFAGETIDSLQALANSIKYPNGKPAEGIVLRGITRDNQLMFSKTLQKMLSVKIINQNYKD